MGRRRKPSNSQLAKVSEKPSMGTATQSHRINEGKVANSDSHLTTKLLERFSKSISLPLLSFFLSIVSLIVAGSSFNLSKKSSEKQLRAYVSFDPGTITLGKLVNAAYKGDVVNEVTIENIGQTPAYHVFATCTLRILPYPLPNDFELPPPDQNVGGETTLFPKQKSNCTTSNNLIGAEAHDLLIDGSKYRLYLYGRIDYQDAFGTSRFTNFMVSAGGPLFKKGLEDTINNIPSRMLWQNGSFHNDAS